MIRGMSLAIWRTLLDSRNTTLNNTFLQSFSGAFWLIGELIKVCFAFINSFLLPFFCILFPIFLTHFLCEYCLLILSISFVWFLCFLQLLSPNRLLVCIFVVAHFLCPSASSLFIGICRWAPQTCSWDKHSWRSRRHRGSHWTRFEASDPEIIGLSARGKFSFWTVFSTIDGNVSWYVNVSSTLFPLLC